jgi:hypothetical protein
MEKIFFSDVGHFRISVNQKSNLKRLYPENQDTEGNFDEKSRVENLVTVSPYAPCISANLNIVARLFLLFKVHNELDRL